MESLKRYVLESVFPGKFSKAVLEAIAMLEAVNINKDFLIKEAGSVERFKEIRDTVQHLWVSENMDQQLNQKAAQKVLNILYLMEIRSPGFTDTDKLHKIHDLGIHNLLDTKFIGQINSDTTPDKADEILTAAVEHQEQSGKVYSNLTPEQEKIWNRVKVYHEFPDGFKWVYAVDSNGNILPSMPSSITAKTMHHCGNNYSGASKDDQYWELRGPDGKAYLTVILTPNGEIQESKSWGNAVNKYRTMIQPYVKWFLMNKVAGVTHRYNYGYAAYNNYGVKDFMADDPEFVDYVLENRPELIGSTEGKILFWRGALDEGIVTVDNLKKWYAQQLSLNDVLDAVNAMPKYYRSSRFGRYAGNNDTNYSYGNTSIFGHNPFEVICAVCGGCPFSKNELAKLVDDGSLSLEEFANYDIKLLDDDMQAVFVAHDSKNLDKLIEIAGQVASFSISPGMIDILLKNALNPVSVPQTNSVCASDYDYESNEDFDRAYDDATAKRKQYDKWIQSVIGILKYMSEGNPPEKVNELATEYFGDIIGALQKEDLLLKTDLSTYDGRLCLDCIKYAVDILVRFRDLPLPDYLALGIRRYMARASNTDNIMEKVLKIGRPKIDGIFSGATPSDIMNMSQDRSMWKKVDARNIATTVGTLALTLMEFPETRELLKRMSPIYKLGVYCKLPEDQIDRNEVVALALKLVDVRETPHLVPSARVGVVCMALSKFPEIMEAAGLEKVLDYFQYQHADELRNMGVSKSSIITPSLNERIVNGLTEMPDDAFADRLDDGYGFLAMMRAIKPNGENYGEAEKALFRRAFFMNPGIFRTSHKGSSFRYLIRNGTVDIPYDEWGRFADKMGKFDFIKHYVYPRYDACAYSDDGLPSFVAKYIVDFFFELLTGDFAKINNNGEYSTPMGMLRTLMLESFMSRRTTKARIQDEVRRQLDAGEHPVTMEVLKDLNAAGLIVKADIKKYAADSVEDVSSVGSTREAELYISNLGRYAEKGKLPQVLRALLEWVIEANSLDSVRYAGKIARWCVKNRDVPGVIDAVPTDTLDRVIDVATDVAATAKDSYDEEMREWEEQERRNSKSREAPELTYLWKWNPQPDNTEYKNVMSALEALEIMRRRCSYQVDMFDKRTLK